MGENVVESTHGTVVVGRHAGVGGFCSNGKPRRRRNVSQLVAPLKLLKSRVGKKRLGKENGRMRWIIALIKTVL